MRSAGRAVPHSFFWGVIPMVFRKQLHRAREALREEAGELVPSARVELLDDREAVVDGCRGILEYGDSLVRLSLGNRVLVFCGEGLTLRSFGEAGAVVEGRITRVEFL